MQPRASIQPSIVNAWMNGLGSYAPMRLLRRLAENPAVPTRPLTSSFYAAVLFADMENFTLLAERLAREDPENGVNRLADYLAIYIGKLVEIINDQGGDVVKFAGDAAFAIWESPDGESAGDQVRHAVYCALSIQRQLHRYEVAPGEKLALRTGVSFGQIYELHLGGQFERWELLYAGDPMSEAGDLGAKYAAPGQVLISRKAARELEQREQGRRDDGRLIVPPEDPADRLPPLTVVHPPQSAAEALRRYIPRAILVGDQDGYDTRAELRMLTVLFCKVRGLSFTAHTPVEEVQAVMLQIQADLYKHEGSINRFGVDEKGAILLAAFGLPPLGHDDDPLRGVQAALEIRQSLARMGYDASVGIATGRAFCGTVGNSTRCEYTMHGANVNLAARLMMSTDSILCDENTYLETADRFNFEQKPPLTVKGRSEPVNTYEIR